MDTYEYAANLMDPLGWRWDPPVKPDRHEVEQRRRKSKAAQAARKKNRRRSK